MLRAFDAFKVAGVVVAGVAILVMDMFVGQRTGNQTMFVLPAVLCLDLGITVLAHILGAKRLPVRVSFLLEPLLGVGLWSPTSCPHRGVITQSSGLPTSTLPRAVELSDEIPLD